MVPPTGDRDDDSTDAPSAEGLAKVASALGATSVVTRVERLHGGIATSVHLVELADPRGLRRVVIKRFPQGAPPPQNEWNALEFAARASLPSPAPLLLDLGGWFGTPCLVTEQLPGRPELLPDDPRRWTAELAGALAAIHATPVLDTADWLRRPAIWQRWDFRGLRPGRRTARVAAAIEALRTRTWATTFCHGDFHPGNVLFAGSTVTGVVDWASARVAPFLSDVGRARAALSIWPGDDYPDEFASSYAETTGRSLDGLASWDVLSGAITLTNAHRLPPHYESLGIVLTPDEVRARAAGFVDRALRQLGGR